jgi:protein-L-isoaspartate(D-aspartate) O-methyltransferase
LNSSFEDYAYQDKAFPIGAGQTISQPYTVAFQSQLLEIKKSIRYLKLELDQDIKRLYCALCAKFTASNAKMNYLQTSALLPKLGIRPKHLTFEMGIKDYQPMLHLIVL